MCKSGQVGSDMRVASQAYEPPYHLKHHLTRHVMNPQHITMAVFPAMLSQMQCLTARVAEQAGPNVQ